MKIIDRIKSAFGFGQRSYAAAKVGRLTNDWTTAVTSANKEIKGDLKTLRARARQLERDNDYVRRYLKALENNVLGSTGIKLQAKSKDLDGTFDTFANDRIERAWEQWGKSASCTVNQRQTWMDVQRVVLRSVARDGSVMIRKVRGFDNDFRFALQVLESDLLDTDYNHKLPNGNVVRMGIELDAFERPVAYHILNGHEGDDFGMKRPTRRDRVPADEIIMPFIAERPHQVTGVPWLSSAMYRLNMLAGYEEAEVTAARVAACKMGFYVKSESGQGYQGEQDANGDLLNNAEAGSFEELPVGTDFRAFDPQHPNGQYGQFIKGCLRGISAGLGISYNSLANDLEGVNYSSIRAGVLEEREEYKSIQNWFIGAVMQPVFDEWLNYALLSNALNLPAAKYEKFAAIEWKPRRWQWVDPLKDTQANVIAVANGFKSRRGIISEAGGDIEDVLDEIAADEQLAAEKGVDLARSEPEDAPPL